MVADSSSPGDSFPSDGYRGQRWEVWTLDDLGQQFVVGWSDRADGGEPARAVQGSPIRIVLKRMNGRARREIDMQANAKPPRKPI